jgi:beta-lactamase regulating signal transducer with metallopeptidase domain/Tol biopolymer transport system component
LPDASQRNSLGWQIVGGVWLLGAVIILIRVTAAVRGLHAIMRDCRDLTDAEIAPLFARCRAEMRVARTVRLVISRGEISPAVTALGWRTWLILPERLLTTLTPSELRLVFLHELAHVRRADVLLQGLWTLAVAVHWFNPVVWLARRRMQADREVACDEAVLASVGLEERADYGRAILKVVEILSPVTPLTAAVGAFGCASTLKRRITMISRYRRASRHWTPLACTLLLALSLAGLTDAVGQPKSASPAQPDLAIAVAAQADVKAAEPSAVRAETGKLYLNGRLSVKNATGEINEVHGIIEVDPQSGAWRKLIDRGHSPRVSPDGQTLAFSDEDKLWNCDTNQALSPGKLADVTGKTSWMRDGKYLVVSSANNQDSKEIDEKGWKTETWQVSADGATKSALPIPSTDFVEDVSPDGRWFVTSSDRHPPLGRGYQLYVMRPDGTEQRRLTKDGLNVYAQFSPDSRRILYLFQNRNGNKLKVINVDGSDERTVASESDGANSVDHAAWSPDGQRVAVIRFDWQRDEKGKLFSSPSADARYRIEIIDADGNNGRILELKDATAVWLGGSMDWR